MNSRISHGGGSEFARLVMQQKVQDTRARRCLRVLAPSPPHICPSLIHSLRGSCPSLTHALGYVQSETGTAIGNVPFTPEIYSGGSLRPICLTAGDDSMVTSICEAAGFPDGGFLVENEDKMYAVDALPVPPFPPLPRLGGIFCICNS